MNNSPEHAIAIAIDSGKLAKITLLRDKVAAGTLNACAVIEEFRKILGFVMACEGRLIDLNSESGHLAAYHRTMEATADLEKWQNTFRAAWNLVPDAQACVAQEYLNCETKTDCLDKLPKGIRLMQFIAELVPLEDFSQTIKNLEAKLAKALLA